MNSKQNLTFRLFYVDGARLSLLFQWTYSRPLRAAFRDGAGALMRFGEFIERGIAAIRNVDKEQTINL